jgi:hypothetical protein
VAGLRKYVEWMTRGRRTNRIAYVRSEFDLPAPLPGAEWQLTTSWRLRSMLRTTIFAGFMRPYARRQQRPLALPIVLGPLPQLVDAALAVALAMPTETPPDRRRILLNSPGCGIFSKPKSPPGAFRHRPRRAELVATSQRTPGATPLRTPAR